MDRQLPIYELEDRIVAGLRAAPRLIVQAPTGSGKSTQVPQILLDRGLAGNGRVVILQPRRLPTRLLAARVARERGGRLGDEVGYQIRFDDRTSARTRIQFETEGVLLRQLLSDPDLRGVTAILFDEFHERHIYGDVTLALALQLQRTRRPDLKLVVMSATLDPGPLAEYLDPCPVLNSAGRTYPVEVEYLPRPPAADEPVWETAAEAVAGLIRSGAPGDALVFMPGAYEINRTLQALAGRPAVRGMVFLPLHGELPTDAQDAAVARQDRRKVVVATNVAETSLTIDGIQLVIDSGLARLSRYDPYRGINTLLIEKISRASADQRAGRAGRTAPGRALRLWTEREHRERALQELPEIRRIDLAETALTLRACGVRDLRAFPWFEPPEPRSLDRAEQLLRDLGAIEPGSGALTGLGRRMASFPLHPRYARMLLAAEQYRCVRPVALIAALTQGRSLLVRGSGKDARDAREERLGAEGRSDFFVLMRAWNYAQRNQYALEACRKMGIHAATARQVGPLYSHFLHVAEKEGLALEEAPAPDEAVQKCVLAGFSDQVAARRDTGTLRCQLVHGRRGDLDRDSTVQESRLLVASEVREVEGRDIQVRLSLATAVDEAWLAELFPGDLREEEAVEWEAEARRVVAVRRRLFRDLVLGQKRGGEVNAEAAATLLAGEVLAGRCPLKAWTPAVEQWINRVNFLHRQCPDAGLPSLGPDERRLALEQICLGAQSYKEVKDRDPWPVLRSFLTPAQFDLLEQWAPERIGLPGGRRARVTYEPDQEPVAAATIQDLYGAPNRLTVAGGRVPVVIQVLAPNQRPVQMTRDLAGFWREVYPRVKQELQRKYPKHEWR